jgi:hypothetical protein
MMNVINNILINLIILSGSRNIFINFVSGASNIVKVINYQNLNLNLILNLNLNLNQNLMRITTILNKKIVDKYQCGFQL